MSLHKTCLICSSGKLRQLKGYEKHDLIKCADCGFVFMKRIPTEEELRTYYSVYAYEYEKPMPESTRISYENLMEDLEPYRLSNKILDVGCGEGWILEIAKQRGWEVYGTEFSSRAFEICQKKGIKMYQGKLEPGKMEEKEYDVIISSETIEHINNPQEEIANIFSLLRKGGLFYATTPNFNSYLRYILKSRYNIIEYPEHLCYYTRKTINRLFKSNGFRKKKLLTTGISITRFQQSKEPAKGSEAGNKTGDEKLRERINKSKILRLGKKIANRFLSWTGIGMTLKAYYTKEGTNP